MTSRISARMLAGLAAVAILAAACGSGNPSSAPTAAATPTPLPATPAPVSTGGQPSLDLSSFHADTQLEELFPDSIGGVAVTPLSMSGAEIMAGGGSTELAATLTALGKSPSDLSAAFGAASGVSIVAFRVKGVSGSEILTALFNAFKQEAGTVITDANVGGKAVKKITPADPDEDTGYVYAAQDVVFLVSSDSDVSEALLAEALSKLP